MNIIKNLVDQYYYPMNVFTHQILKW